MKLRQVGGWFLLAALSHAPDVTARVVEVVLVDTAGAAVADAAVMVRADARPTSSSAVVIDQIERQFVPHASIVPLGSAVMFPNKDNIRHHVYSFSPVKTFELKLYSGTPAAPVVFDRPGIAVLGCNIHDGMVAFVYVVDTPLATLSDAAGSARLADVADDAKTLEIWHPQLDAPLVIELDPRQRERVMSITLALDAHSVAPPPLD